MSIPNSSHIPPSVPDSATLIADLLEKMDNDPLAAAEELEKTANDMVALATKLREAAVNANLDRDRCPGGLTDKVKIQVVGPDNKIKHTVEA